VIPLSITAKEQVLKDGQEVASEMGSQTVLFHQGSIYIRANDVTLRQLFNEIGMLTGIAIMPFIPLDQTVTVDVRWYSIDETLKQILSDHSYVYANTRSPRLWILPQDDRNHSVINNVSLNTQNEYAESGIPLQLQDLGSDPEVREDVLIDIDRLGQINAFELHANAIIDADYTVREAAIVSLSEIGGVEAIDVLTIALADQDPRIREEAVDALGEIGGDLAILVLKQALDDEVLFVRHAAEEVLGQLQK
jgi:HEAT repeat protein